MSVLTVYGHSRTTLFRYLMNKGKIIFKHAHDARGILIVIAIFVFPVQDVQSFFRHTIKNLGLYKDIYIKAEVPPSPPWNAPKAIP